METIRKVLKSAFNLTGDQASTEEIKERIVSGSTIGGTNLCVLILAIIIASVGLNMNSTAVIIGAMLISPLMGSIMAMGFGIATNDMDLFKKSTVGLVLQVTVSLLSSTLYFMLSPISTASSEILSRTNPTIWDVLIAMAGGLAGIIGTTRKEKSNVIPGVAIATALMPPLCTAGFGIANRDLSYFLGAIYLFFINCFFICLGTIIFLKLMRYPTKEFIDIKVRRKVKRNIIIMAIIMVLPSIYLAYQIVNESILDNNVNKYISSEFKFDNTQVVKSQLDKEDKEIEIALIGETIDDATIDELKQLLSNYHLQNYSLKITQTYINSGVSLEEVADLVDTKVNSSNSAIDITANSQIEALNDEIVGYKSQLLEYKARDIDVKELTLEAKSLYSYISSISVGYVDDWNDENQSQNTYLVAVIKTTATMPINDKETLSRWLETKTGCSEVLIYDSIVDKDSSDGEDKNTKGSEDINEDENTTDSEDIDGVKNSK